MKVNNERKENSISLEDFDTFLHDKDINPEVNKDKLFESFILFQKFMSYMLGKQAKERKESNNPEQGMKLIELNEKNINQSLHIDNDIRLTEERKNIKEKKDKNEGKNTSTQYMNMGIPLNNSQLLTHKEYINYDDIPIKPMTSNFVELVEKNLAELHYQPEIKNENNEKKIRRNVPKREVIQPNKRNQLSQSLNARTRKKSISPDKEERIKSLPKTIKQSNKKKEANIMNNQIEEEIKDEQEEKPKDLPNFIKEKGENDANQMNDENNASLVACEEINHNNNPKVFSHSDSLKHPPLHGEDSLIKQHTYQSQPKSHRSESDDIINNCDSFEEEEKVIDTKAQKEINRKEKAKELMEELNKIKGNVNSIISNPIYHKLKENKKPKIKNENSNAINPNELNKQMLNYEEEIAKLKAEQVKCKQMKKEYYEMKEALQRDIEAFNFKKKKEYLEIERIKNEEMNKANKMKPSKSINNQPVLKQQQIENQSFSKKDKEEIEQLKSQIVKLQEEAKIKENNNKQTIEKYKKKLQETNSEISQLRKANRTTNQLNITSNINTYRNAISYTNPDMKPNEKKNFKVKSTSSNKKHTLTKRNINNTNIKVIKDEHVGDTFELSFPSKYNIGINDVILKREQLGEGKEMLTYSNNMKEIIFPSGVKKKVYEDGYQIIFFSNNDIKQIFPNGKNVYYFAESKITQTSFPNNSHIYLFPNGQIEKHHPNGNKEIISKPGGLSHKTNINLSQSNSNSKKKKEVAKTNRLNKNTTISLIKMKTIKNKDGSELFEFN